MVFVIFEAIFFVVTIFINVYVIAGMIKNKMLIEKYDNKIAVEDANNKIYLIWAFIFGVQSLSGFMQFFGGSAENSVKAYGYLFNGIAMLLGTAIFIIISRKSKISYVTPDGIIIAGGFMKKENYVYNINGDTLEVSHIKHPENLQKYRISGNFKELKEMLVSNYTEKE